MNTNEEPVISDQPKDVPAETADEIKSQIEHDINEMKEKESVGEKDWAAEFKQIEDKYLRLYADFENHRRRTAAERLELFRTANQETLVSLLPVLDDFERALKSMGQDPATQAFRTGIELVQSKLTTTLQSKGLKVMESLGKPFDADFHEAITKIPVTEEDRKGTVVDEVEKGYFLGDKVIRFAKVVVGE
jgi:molecular chaperone GrpE